MAQSRSDGTSDHPNPSHTQNHNPIRCRRVHRQQLAQALSVRLRQSADVGFVIPQTGHRLSGVFPHRRDMVPTASRGAPSHHWQQ